MTSPLSASYSKQKSWRPGGSSSEPPLLLLSLDSSQSGFTGWVEPSARANQNEREEGDAAKTPAHRNYQKNSIKKASKLPTDPEYVCVCVRGAVNQDFNFSFSLHSSTIPLESKYKLQVSCKYHWKLLKGWTELCLSSNPGSAIY